MGCVIVGTGTDIVEIDRVQRSIERFGQAFLERVFTPGEIRYCQARNKGAAESFAARFAAKEAAAKALGTGMARGVGWKEIEVVRQAGERPTVRFSGRAGQHAERLGVTAAHLSLTHDRTSAMAMVVLEGEAGPREHARHAGRESTG